MIHLCEKCGAELADKLAELERLRKCDEVKTAKLMTSVSDAIDHELLEYRRMEREGTRLIEQGVTLDRLREIQMVLRGQSNDTF